MKYFASIALSGIIAATLNMAAASPPPGTDLNSPESRWVQSLTMNGMDLSCCSLADCRKVDYRINNDKIEGLINGSWVVIPKEKILKRENPTGFAWACYRQYVKTVTSDDILCFVLQDLS